ncbi:MAG: hypothetical protein J5911_02815 [Clostridia bacterium]|nr:hypothetical protein [Clostridia bacterium]
MVDLLPLLQETSAYKTVLSDKKADRLSHAYLLISADKSNISGYLKLFAKLIMDIGEDDLRAEKLIDEDVHPDVLTFPKKDDAVRSEDISEIIAESFLRPIESDKKLFLIDGGETMNAVSQNKLLKTLEEPPSGVYILIGAASEYPLLPTLKSRVKKLVIPPFSADKLYDALTEECPDAERLAEAVSCGDGTVGKALALYGDENLSETVALAEDTFINMQTSREVLEFSNRITALKDGVKGYISVMELLNRDLMLYYNGGIDAVFNKKSLQKIKDAKGFNAGATVYIAEKIAEAERRLNANGNAQTVLERFLFAFLEGKHKWQKL